VSAALQRPAKPVRVGKARKDAPCERTVQRGIVGALRAMGYRVIHIPNGVKYAGTVTDRVRQAAVMRADGMVPGTPDLLVCNPKAPSGLSFGWIEVKREGSALSEAQIGFRDSCARDGFNWCAVCTLDEAIAALKAWGWIA